MLILLPHCWVIYLFLKSWVCVRITYRDLKSYKYPLGSTRGYSKWEDWGWGLDVFMKKMT